MAGLVFTLIRINIHFLLMFTIHQSGKGSEISWMTRFSEEIISSHWIPCSYFQLKSLQGSRRAEIYSEIEVLMNRTHQICKQLEEITAGQGKKISPRNYWIFKTYSAAILSVSGVLLPRGRRLVAVLFGLFLVNYVPQALADGRWLHIDNLPVCSFYVNVTGWWVWFLQKLLLKHGYHLV